MNDPVFAYTYTPTSTSPAQGLAYTDAFSGALTRDAGQNVTTYNILQAGLTIKNGATDVSANYNITYNGTTFTIVPRPITIDVTASQSKVYGANDQVFAYTYTPTSNSPVQGLAFTDAFSGALTRAAGETVLGSPYAINKGTLTIKNGTTDVSSNYNISFIGSTFVINPANVATSVIAIPNTQQYSDMVKLCAVITGGAALLPGGPNAAQTVTFRIGTQIIATNVPLVVSGADLKANFTAALLEPSPTGQMAPGTRNVTATINGADPNFSLTNSAPTTPLTITKEDAKITYTGLTLVATTGTATTANVTLTATIQDISAVSGDPAYDNYAGDIRNATITFRVDGVDKATVPIGLVNSNDSKTGTAILPSTSLGLGDHTIELRLNGYYTGTVSGDNQFVIQVYQATGDFITGGGYLKLTSNSNGAKPGDALTKNNFGFNVKYNKGGTNLQGNINTIFRRMEGGVLRVYQVKGNSMTSLSVDPSITTSHPYPTAVFNGKANVTDITNPLSPIAIGGNYTLQVSMTDAGEPGSSDQIGIIVYNSAGGVYFSSNWNGTSTVQQIIDGGNLVVHGNKIGTQSTTAQVNPTTAVVQPDLDLSDKFGVKVYGNPTQYQFTLFLEGNSKENVRLSIYDNNGRLVQQIEKGYGQNIQFGEGFKSGTYIVEVRQATNRKVIKLIKQ